jgi:hypothetical protein
MSKPAETLVQLGIVLIYYAYVIWQLGDDVLQVVMITDVYWMGYCKQETMKLTESQHLIGSCSQHLLLPTFESSPIHLCQKEF